MPGRPGVGAGSTLSSRDTAQVPGLPQLTSGDICFITVEGL